MSLPAIHAATLFDKIWSRHVVAQESERFLLYVDRAVVDDVRAPHVLASLAKRGLPIRRPDLVFVVQDHTTPSFPTHRGLGGSDFLDATRAAAHAAGLTLFDVGDAEQGISHVTMPELGVVPPGSTYVCVDSHAPTVGGLGALGFGCGSSELEHVLATQTIWLKKPRQHRIRLDGALAEGVSAKDVILHVLRIVGREAMRGAAVEFCGDMIAREPIEGRLTISNMAVELGARTSLMAPDAAAMDWLAARHPQERSAELAGVRKVWSALRSDAGAAFETDLHFDCASVEPQITWGTSPSTAIPVTSKVPSAGDAHGLAADKWRRAIDYMDLTPGKPLLGKKVDRVFIGSCTNSRLPDLASAARVLRGRRVAQGVTAVVVPGSRTVARQAERAGLREIFVAAGFQWGEPGCSMCAGGGGERLQPGERVVSTTNRNFEGRQGAGVRTHLASPATAAAAAVCGVIADPRRLAPNS